MPMTPFLNQSIELLQEDIQLFFVETKSAPRLKNFVTFTCSLLKAPNSSVLNLDRLYIWCGLMMSFFLMLMLIICFGLLFNF